jgi:hypothetical protein
MRKSTLTVVPGIWPQRHRDLTRRSPWSSSSRRTEHRCAAGSPPAAAFLQRAVELIAEPARRTDRVLSAARAAMQAGAFDRARGLLATAEAGELDEFQLARDLLHGQIAFI